MPTKPPTNDNLSDQDPERDGDEPEVIESELSLAELSQAYASVLKQNEGSRDVEELVDDEDVGSGAEEREDSDTAEDQDGDGQGSIDQLATRRRKDRSKSIQELDAEDNAHCPVSPKSIVESLLFVGAPSGQKLTPKKIAAVMRDVSPKEVKKIFGELNQDYERQNSAFRVVDDEGNFKLQLCSDLKEVQNYFFGRNKAAKLSQGAIDVLAVVAYNQPVSKAKVEKIRTSPSGGVLGQLLRRNLISVVDDGEPKKKEKRYQTTDRFLKLFGLDSLSDLPQTSVVSDLEELTDY